MAKNLEDIQWIEVSTPDRGMQLACSVGDAEIYTKLSKSWLLKVLDKYQIRRYTPGHGRTKYITRADLDSINRLRSEVRIEEGATTSPGQLLASAAALLEQVQAGQTDASAIAAWLELYQQSKE